MELSPEAAAQLAARSTGLTLAEERLHRGSVLIVKTVAAASPAARVGIRQGDLVREVNSTEVATLADFRRAAARARRSGQLVLLVQRGYAAERIAFDFQ
jgi:S1-C subfamily serine protease